MFLIHTLFIFIAIYSISAILAEIIFSSESEKKMPTAVRIGFSYFLSLLYFFGAWVLMSIRQAWALGILLIIIYAYGKFGNIFKAFDGAYFKQLLKNHLKLLGVFLILANIFFLPLHWEGQYGPFTEGGGDITVYSDTAKRLDDYNLSAAGFEEGASLQKRIHHIKHMLDMTYTDDFFALPKKFTNPPNADYQTTVMAFNFSVHSSVYTPFAQFHFLSGDTNYPAYFAVQAFLYACLIASVFGFFRSFGWVPAIFAALLFTSSHSYISSIYNHYTAQAVSVTILGLFLGAVPHVRLFSMTGLKTYIVSISTCWVMRYNHFIPILLPLMTMASLHWFYPKSPPQDQKEDKKKTSWLQKACFFMGWSSLAIFALVTHISALKNALEFFNGILRSFHLSNTNATQVDRLAIFSEKWLAKYYGFLSTQHYYPFVIESKLVQMIIPCGITAGFIVFATGVVVVIAAKLKPANSKENNLKTWHLIGIYTALISTMLLYTPVSQLSIYTQAKSAQYLLTCTYFILLLPFVIFFRSDKSFAMYVRTSNKSDWKFITISTYMVSLIFFALMLLIPRVVYLKKDGNQEHRSSILGPSYFSEAKKIISQDDKAFVLFEPRISSDIYFGSQPFSGYRAIPTQHLFLRKYDKSTDATKGTYVDALPSEFIEPKDLPHLWSLTSKDKRTWQAERLVFRRSPNLYFTGHAYQKNYGLKHRANRFSKSFDHEDQGLFSYLRSGTAMVYLPPGGPYHLEVTVLHRDENNKEKSDRMAEDIAKMAKARKFKSLTSMKQDGPIITMEYLFEKSNSPRLSLVCRYDEEFWFSARLDGKDIVAK